jgi:arsenate reductase (thioredoxin)
MNQIRLLLNRLEKCEMNSEQLALNNLLLSTIEMLQKQPIATNRFSDLAKLVRYIVAKRKANKDVQLNFICTHNSRRSQLAQVWGQFAADYHGIPAKCFSGGVEVTAFNQRGVDSLIRSGFDVAQDGEKNPIFGISYSPDSKPIQAFSKLYDDDANPKTNFAAVMTCGHADENCPFIPGTEARIPLRYNDPKAFDDTEVEAQRYDERSMQIASELFYVFSQVKAQL